jgi:hypothetical protein
MSEEFNFVFCLKKQNKNTPLLCFVKEKEKNPKTIKWVIFREKPLNARGRVKEKKEMGKRI